MKEKSTPKSVTLDLLRNNLLSSPQDLATIDLEDIFRALHTLDRKPFNLEPKLPTPEGMSREWIELFYRISMGLSTRDPESIHDIADMLFGEDLTSDNVYLLNEIIINYFAQLASFIQLFGDEDGSRLPKEMIKGIVEKLEGTEEGKLIKLPLLFCVSKIEEAMELARRMRDRGSDLSTMKPLGSVH